MRAWWAFRPRAWAERLAWSSCLRQLASFLFLFLFLCLIFLPFPLPQPPKPNSCTTKSKWFLSYPQFMFFKDPFLLSNSSRSVGEENKVRLWRPSGSRLSLLPAWLWPRESSLEFQGFWLLLQDGDHKGWRGTTGVNSPCEVGTTRSGSQVPPSQHFGVRGTWALQACLLSVLSWTVLPDQLFWSLLNSTSKHSRAKSSCVKYTCIHGSEWGSTHPDACVEVSETLGVCLSCLPPCFWHLFFTAMCAKLSRKPLGILPSRLPLLQQEE